MKKLALINTYCNNWERLNLLHNNITKLKELGIDSLVYSPLPLPKEITEIADFTIISKENPLLRWPERAMTSWQTFNPYPEKLVVAVPDYGWASLYQYKKLIEYAITLDYDHFYPMIYDIVIDETLINILNNPHPKLFFNIDKSSIGLANNFLSLSKKNAKKLPPLMVKEKYFECSIAEELMLYLCNSIEGEISPYFIKDEISEIHPLQTRNFVPNHFDFNLFIDTTKKFKFFIYNFKQNLINLTLKINGENFDLTFTPENNIFQYPNNLTGNDHVQITYNNQTIDLSQFYSSKIDISYWID